MATYNQPTAEPTNKILAAGIGGAVSVVLAWLLGVFGVDVPAEVAAAMTTIIAFAFGYMTKEKVPLTK
jgi:hypothetical protein